MRSLISFLLFSISFLGFATAHELSYFTGTWDEAKAKATAEHKYIFVDCYTDWCGWCKVMDKETMTEHSVVELLSDKFVSVKMDMEHGEGVKLAMKYHVRSFPTFLFFSPEGTFVYVSNGYQKPKEFIGELNNVLNKEKQFSAPGFSAAINVAFPDFYKASYGEKTKNPPPADVVAYLNKQTDLFSEVNWGVLSRFDLNEKYQKHFFDNIKKYEQLYGANDVDRKLQSILYNNTRTAIKAKNNVAFDKVLQQVDAYVKNDAAEMKLNLRLDYYKEVRDWTNFMMAFAEHIKAHGYDNVDFINSLCWDMYEQCDDKKALIQSIEYMRTAVAKEPQYAGMDTYAALLYKTGQLKEAEEWANKAIAQGKEEGGKTESTEELLTKIKAAQARTGAGKKS